MEGALLIKRSFRINKRCWSLFQIRHVLLHLSHLRAALLNAVLQLFTRHDVLTDVESARGSSPRLSRNVPLELPVTARDARPHQVGPHRRER